MKPFGNKVIVVIDKEYKKEKGKQIMNEDGLPAYDLNQEGKVKSSGIAEISKGDKIIANYRGGMPIRNLENKKSVTIIFEEEDIYAIN